MSLQHSPKAPLVLALDADPIGRDGSGNETYLRGIIAGLQDRLEPQDRLILVGSQPEALSSVAAGTTAILEVAPGLRGEAMWGRRAMKAGATVALGHWNVPVRFAGVVSVILHDVAWRRVPDTFPFALRLRLEATVRYAVHRADLIVTVSQFSKRELLEVYPGLSPERVVVASNAPHPRFSNVVADTTLAELQTRFDLPRHFALAVGNLQPRKNLSAAAKACRRAGIPLVIAGRPVWGNGPPETGALGAQWLGYVKDDDLVGLYRLCRLLVYPSLYEGFGLPVIEAMAAGAPVVCSSRSALPETAGGAALLVSPSDIDELTQAVSSLATDETLAANLSKAGIERASRLRWEDSAASLLSALKKTVQGRAPALTLTHPDSSQVAR